MSTIRKVAAVVMVAGMALPGLAMADPSRGGMMGGYGGMGPGMMGGQYGPGMMGGQYGPGMMGGGYGHGMMGGYGPGMMGAQGGLFGIELDDKQRKSVNAIQDELRRKRWELMGRTMDEQSRLRDLYDAEKRDPKAIGAAYQRIFDLRRQMIEATVAAHNRIEEQLTPEQRKTARDYWGRSWRGRMMGN
ncbi:MAG: Spy/CpxP family protein refolding chaperone [Denitratisoma sp.]|nr:Spy/CpxP family protein refolding chaperone [Denitratisoma sp.]